MIWTDPYTSPWHQQIWLWHPLTDAQVASAFGEIDETLIPEKVHLATPAIGIGWFAPMAFDLHPCDRVLCMVMLLEGIYVGSWGWFHRRSLTSLGFDFFGSGKNAPTFEVWWSYLPSKAIRSAGMALASVNGCGFRGGTKMHQLRLYQETHKMKPWNHYTQLVSFPYCNPE